MVNQLEISLEEAEDGGVFAHIKADQPVFGYGHAKKIKAEVPLGAYVTVPPKLQPTVTKYLTKKCGFEYLGHVDEHDVLLKVSE